MVQVFFFFGNKCSQPLSEYCLISPSKIYSTDTEICGFFFKLLFLPLPFSSLIISLSPYVYWFWGESRYNLGPSFPLVSSKAFSLIVLAFQKFDHDMFRCFNLFIMVIFIKFPGALCCLFFFFSYLRKILPLFHGMLFQSFSLSSLFAIFIFMNISGHSLLILLSVCFYLIDFNHLSSVG